MGTDDCCGATFPDIRTGIRAQIQHLKAYACADAPVNACVDRRFKYATCGIAPRVTDLNNHWCIPGDGYGEAILSLMSDMCNY